MQTERGGGGEEAGSGLKRDLLSYYWCCKRRPNSGSRKEFVFVATEVGATSSALQLDAQGCSFIAHKMVRGVGLLGGAGAALAFVL
eukprot:1684560-Rhodomonas_salina.1